MNKDTSRRTRDTSICSVPIVKLSDMAVVAISSALLGVSVVLLIIF